PLPAVDQYAVWVRPQPPRSYPAPGGSRRGPVLAGPPGISASMLHWYAKPKRLRSVVAHLWSWAIGSSTREAQRSFDIAASRHDAGPFVITTSMRHQDTANHP